MPKRSATGLTYLANRKFILATTGLSAPPVQSAASTSTTGGTGLAAATAYYYVVTALNANGETLQSNERTVTTGAGATNSNTVNWAAVSGATGYKVYRSLVTGVYTAAAYYTVGAVTTMVDTGAAPTGNATPPVRDTTGDKVYNPGDAVTNAVLKTYRKFDALLSRRMITPSAEIYPIRKSSGRLKKPKPTHINASERANL